MAREISFYEVLVGNIGAVYKGNSSTAARKKFATYVKASKSQYGRASGEEVTLWKDGDIIKTHESRMGEGYTSNPGLVLNKLRKGITGRIKLVRGKLIIKT